MLRMAYRNLWRSKRRTIITLSSIVFATFLVSITRFFTYGTHRDTVDLAVNLGSGYLQIAAYGWIESGNRLERALDFTPEVVAGLKEAGIEDYSLRIQSGALISKGAESRFVEVMSFDPEREKKITQFHSRIYKGSYLNSQSGDRMSPLSADREANNNKAASNKSNHMKRLASGEYVPVHNAIIGYQLAEYLGADIGDEITLVSSQFDGSIGAILANVTGIIRAGHAEVDNNLVLLNLEAGRRLFAPDAGSEYERYTSIAIPASGPGEAAKKRSILKDYFPSPETDVAPEDSDNYEPVILDWEEMNQDLTQYLLLDQLGNEVVLLFLLLIMAFGVLTTVELSIHERTREFGILMAVGTTNGRITSMVMMEVILLLTAGIAIGFAAGSILCFYFYFYPIILGGDLAEMMTEYGAVPRIRPIVDTTESYIAILSLAIPSLFFSWLGARRIRNLRPVEVIGTL